MIFVGILGVVGIFEDISILLGQESGDESKIYIKYYVAIIGTVNFIFAQYVAKNVTMTSIFKKSFKAGTP